MVRRVAALLACVLAADARVIRVKLYQREVIRLSLEDYVAGVMMGEVSTFQSTEARKAMAIAIRTWAVRYAGRHALEGYDFCESTHCQDFRSGDAVSEAVRAAVETTSSELLWYQGRPAATFYTGHCGGQSASGREIWPDLIDAPYLRVAADSWCLARGRAQWSRTLPAPLQILRRSASGRVLEVMLNGRRQSGELFPSNWFEAAGPRISGFGKGHGVGLCQVGADERGKAGQSYEQILKAYYPATVPGISASGLRWRVMKAESIEVLATDESSLRQVVALADRALREAAQILPVSAPRVVRIRVYPTVAVYRDATGDSGGIAATTSGNLIRLQPPSALRASGGLYSTLRHEMLHVLIETNAAPKLPTWFREELAQRPQRYIMRFGRQTLVEWIRSGVLPAGVAPRPRTAPTPSQQPRTRQ